MSSLTHSNRGVFSRIRLKAAFIVRSAALAGEMKSFYSMDNFLFVRPGVAETGELGQGQEKSTRWEFGLTVH